MSFAALRATNMFARTAARTMLTMAPKAPMARNATLFAAGLGAAAATATAFTQQQAACSSIPEMLANIAAKVEALEAKMGGEGSSSGDRFGFYDMAGKNVVVTGGASGIGYAICELFAKRGATVQLLDLFPEPTMKAAAELTAKGGGKVVGRACNVGDEEAVKKVFADILADGARIDVMVNNAGIAAVGDVGKCTGGDMDRVYKVNIRGVFHCLQQSCNAMTADNKGGVIVNLASIASLVGIKDRFAYGMTKGAVLTMTYSVATDYMQRGIRCNCVAPTRIHTPFVDGFIKKNYPGKEAEVFEKLSKYTPIGRMGQPKEVASLVYFLCTEEAAMMTGCCYNVDGGVTTCVDGRA